MSKKFSLIISLFVILLLITAGYYFLHLKTPISSYVSDVSSKPKVPSGQNFDITKFEGVAVSLEGNIIKVTGIFVSSTTLPAEISGLTSIMFAVSSTTKFDKTEYLLPDVKLSTPNSSKHGSIKVSDMSKVSGEGSMSDFLKLVSQNPGRVTVDADFSSSIYNTGTPVATKVFYTITTDAKK